MARKTIGIYIDEDVLKEVDKDAQREDQPRGWNRSRQIEFELAKARGLWKPPEPHGPHLKPQSKSPKAVRG